MLNVMNPNELFAEECLVQGTFRFGALGVAKGLDPGSTKVDLAPEARVSLPMWLIPDLYKRNMVSFEMPEVYNDRFRRKLNAGAEVLSLRNKAPYFYEVGIKGNSMLQDVELSGFLSRTFRQRYEDLISKGLNTMTGEEVLELLCKLSTEEQQLFEGGRASIVTTERWMHHDLTDYQVKDERKKRPAADASTAGKENAKQARQ